ncbi:jerky protein homolog-like [Littorina saxatilis]|uniref:jerky protein homolog-like n=1 Tax=Littorina saxatilis TaxID=31220 RepID=UPI0038B42B81
MNRINHSFNKEKKTAGKDWYRLFKRRHPEISLRQPEATSFARAEGFNREAVNRYFNLLEELVDDISLHASRIFNMDETGISTVQKRCQKVLAQKGKHQIGSMSSGERGVNTTIVVCASAAGNYVPPFVIFKRKRMPPSLAEGSPVGSVVTCNDSGWMDGNMFYTWLQHFIKHVMPNVEEKVLIVLDGHKSHTSNLDAINLAREHGVIPPTQRIRHSQLIAPFSNLCKLITTRL